MLNKQLTNTPLSWTTFNVRDMYHTHTRKAKRCLTFTVQCGHSLMLNKRLCSKHGIFLVAHRLRQFSRNAQNISI